MDVSYKMAFFAQIRPFLKLFHFPLPTSQATKSAFTIFPAMNKIVLIIALVALTTTFSFSQENSLKFGARASFNMHNVFGYGPPSDIGTGFGGGATAIIPIVSCLNFNPELNFYYRKLNIVNLDKETAKREAYITEFVIGIPVMFQFTPIETFPLYLIAGAQLDIPLASESKTNMTITIPAGPMAGELEISEFEIPTEMDRAIVDFGAVVGFGYKISQNFAIDIRSLIGLTALVKEKSGRPEPPDQMPEAFYGMFYQMYDQKLEEKSSSNHGDKWYSWIKHIQYGLGLSYFF